LTNSAPNLAAHPLSLYYPILIFAMGIVSSMITAAIASRVTHFENKMQGERFLQNLPFICTIVMSPILLYLCYYCLPEQIMFEGQKNPTTPFHVFISSLLGLWGGYVISLSSEFYTSHDYSPVQEVATSCRTGSATDIIYGLALGYSSTIITVTGLIIVIYISYICAGLYGISAASCSMLSTLAIILSIITFGPIADNASGLSKVFRLSQAIEHTDDLHAAGKVAMGNGRCFEIGAASMIALGLFGAFAIRYKVLVVDLLQPVQFAGLVIGAMLPYVFASQILQSVSRSAGGIETEIKNQTALKRTNVDEAIRRCTDDSLLGMIKPAMIVFLIPLLTGIAFGAGSLCGILAGTIVSGVQIGISFVNSGVAWDNAKRYIEGITIRK